jgi:SAM-dependent methyltransferase
MITKAEYDHLAKHWKGKVYQKWPKFSKRMAYFEQFLPLFKGKKVLEVGSNAGMYAWHIAPLAAFYVGVERERHYFDQAKTIGLGKATFYNMSFHGFLKHENVEYDTLLASFTLHHLRPKEVRELQCVVLPRCSLVVIHTRSGDPFRAGHGEAESEHLAMWKRSPFRAMLEAGGFEHEFHLKHGMNVIVARRTRKAPMVVHGTGSKVARHNYKCPNDGIHRKKSSGGIRGFYLMHLGERSIYYGNWAYYLPQGDTGLKVFYSLKFRKATETEKSAKRRFEIMAQLKGICPDVHELNTVYTNISCDGKRYVGEAPGIIMEHVHFPEKIWHQFAVGYPYRWDAVDHPDHTPKGFKAFRRRVEHAITDIDHAFDALSIGNIVWCCKREQWYLVDIR